MNKFRQEIEITKTKRCDQKLSRKKKKKEKQEPSMVNAEHQMSCLLIIAGDWAQHSSRSLWTCFLCHTAPENPISSLLSDFPVSWVLSLLLKWPFCLSISQLKHRAASSQLFPRTVCSMTCSLWNVPVCFFLPVIYQDLYSWNGILLWRSMNG